MVEIIMDELEKLRRRMRRHAIGYYIIGGLSIVLAITSLFISLLAAIIFVSYTVVLYILGIKGYKLSNLEGGEKSYFVLAILVAVFNFLISVIVFAHMIYLKDPRLLVSMLIFAAVGTFSVFSAVTAKKMGKCSSAYTNVQPFIVGRGQPVMGYILAEEEV